MKKLLISLCMLLVTSVCHAQSYIEAQGGAVTNPQAAYGIRGGVEVGPWDLSLGYWASHDAPVSDPGSDKLTLHTVDIEAYSLAPLKHGITLKLGGGAGFTMPELNNSKADNDYSLILGGGLDYQLTPRLSIGTMARRIFFSSKTRNTSYSSHSETLSTGQDVEITDEVTTYDSVNFDTILVTVGIKYLF